MRDVRLISTFLILYLRQFRNLYLSVTFIPTIILRVFVILTFTVVLKAGATERRAKHGRKGFAVADRCDGEM